MTNAKELIDKIHDKVFGFKPVTSKEVNNATEKIIDELYNDLLKGYHSLVHNIEYDDMKSYTRVKVLSDRLNEKLTELGYNVHVKEVGNLMCDESRIEITVSIPGFKLDDKVKEFINNAKNK